MQISGFEMLQGPYALTTFVKLPLIVVNSGTCWLRLSC